MKVKDISRVLVIGAGGTGSILLPQLARFLRSEGFKGRFIIADGDSYSDSNASRQLFSLAYVGKNKAEYQATAITSQLPDMNDYVEFINEYLTEEKINELITENTVVFNCVDNLAARKYVEDRCSQLENACHICCGNELSTGQVQVNLKRSGKGVTPPIYKHSPNFNSNNGDRAKMDCHQLADLPGGGQLIGANMMAAAFALNFFIQLTMGPNVSCGSTFFNCFTNGVENRDKVALLE